MKNIVFIVGMVFSAVAFAKYDLVDPSSENELAASSIDEKTRIERIQNECREWAVQDGVPQEELAEYIKECVEARQAQE